VNKKSTFDTERRARREKGKLSGSEIRPELAAQLKVARGVMERLPVAMPSSAARLKAFADTIFCELLQSNARGPRPLSESRGMRRMGRRGMVASPHYLATESGLRVLRTGGSAVDAAIATNAVLAVVTPYMCGLGGDLFAQVYDAGSRDLSGLNGSGRAAAEATAQRLRELAAGSSMPQRGPLTVTVPGCVEAWGRLHERFGRLPWAELFTDAIEHAASGFPASAGFAAAIERSKSFFHPETPAAETFLPNGVLPVEGQIVDQPRLARTLSTIAATGPDDYYRGAIGRELVRALSAVGGLLSTEDLATHQSEWVEPLSLQYRDIDVFELPPNSQGIIALMMLDILQHLSSREIARGGETYVHLLAEAARLAYADREAYITDPEHMNIEPDQLLSGEYGRERALLVRDRATAQSRAGSPGDTVYLCTADRDGNLVSLIESNYMGIGSGIMAGETGVMLQNRGAWFSLDDTHPNVIAPRKRTMHTLMPGMAFRHGKPWLVFGTMGGSTQAQIHVQILTRLIDQGLPIDLAIDAPRFDAVAGSVNGRPRLSLETRFDDEVQADLFARGHAVDPREPYTSEMGHAHAIQVMDNGVYVGASDPRSEGLALGY
jgi:gamma-glutamyltranspeptidase